RGLCPAAGVGAACAHDGWPPTDPAATGGGFPAARAVARVGRPSAPAEGDLAPGDQGKAERPLRLVSGLARPRLATRRMRRRGSGVAADRRAVRWQDQVRVLELAGGHQLQAGGPPVEEPLAGGTGLPTVERGTGPGSF